jgi:hypothetical protein
LIDRWLAAHPEHPPLPHLEDDAAGAIDADQAESNAAVGATDRGSIGSSDDAADSAQAESESVDAVTSEPR